MFVIVNSNNIALTQYSSSNFGSLTFEKNGVPIKFRTIDHANGFIKRHNDLKIIAWSQYEFAEHK
jgi:hypothetical protein